MGGEPSSVEEIAFDIVNQQRRKHAINALKIERELIRISRNYSETMLDQGFFSHESPSGETPFDRVATQHRTLIGTASENIWMGSAMESLSGEERAQKIVDGWMSSPPHREGILTAEYTHSGLGVAERGGEVRATQLFATVVAYLDFPLPSELKAGGSVTLGARAAGGGAAPEHVSLAIVGGEEGPPQKLPTLLLPSTPGRYGLKFWIPMGGDEFQIFPGPAIRLLA